jgi:hypothetical protein
MLRVLRRVEKVGKALRGSRPPGVGRREDFDKP